MLPFGLIFLVFYCWRSYFKTYKHVILSNKAPLYQHCKWHLIFIHIYVHRDSILGDYRPRGTHECLEIVCKILHTCLLENIYKLSFSFSERSTSLPTNSFPKKDRNHSPVYWGLLLSHSTLLKLGQWAQGSPEYGNNVYTPMKHQFHSKTFVFF